MKEPKFQRRHYRRIAAVLRDAGPHPLDRHSASAARWGIVKVMMGDMLAADNPRFNRGKFEEACEP